MQMQVAPTPVPPSGEAPRGETNRLACGDIAANANLAGFKVHGEWAGFVSLCQGKDPGGAHRLQHCVLLAPCFFC